ncbi:MmcQ/YjbR family DNA-binding protein [Hugenholtzia roseola]|uniref:MmcQ/YjbR family DNA-binding protein n=1 Tax=Hugenholtzia roseola TaxID=1002 RepID=UPI000420E3E2|nr:MmcQ/YjbR family DNA-binding protein [Hugenholtzia roseola]
MTLSQFKAFCLQFKGVTEEYPFDETTLAFKVGGKIFALADTAQFSSLNLKCDPEKALELRARTESVRGGYHMNKKHWNTIDVVGELDDTELKFWISHAYDLVFKGLPKKRQAEILESQP